MKYSVKDLKNKVLNGGSINREEAIFLSRQDLDELCKSANEIREKICGNMFDLCTIINGKSGRCSENCKYCAQSISYNTKIQEYPLLSSKPIVEEAVYNYSKGILRYSIVTSGKRLSDKEVDSVCDSLREIQKKCDISLCGSFGLLNKEQFVKLKNSGLKRVHNNLESSRKYFSKVCTTHTYDEKIETIKMAREAGLNVCSGGIVGLGETMEDRIDLALQERELNVKSIPVNMLNPIKGTPYENNKVLTNDEMCRIVALFRFINPDANIRLAGGRGLLPDKGKKCFMSGANAAISGDMLTTSGITIDYDMKMLKDLGYKVGMLNE